MIGNDRVLEGQAAYRLGQAYDKIGEGETALQVGIFWNPSKHTVIPYIIAELYLSKFCSTSFKNMKSWLFYSEGLNSMILYKLLNDKW